VFELTLRVLPYGELTEEELNDLVAGRYPSGNTDEGDDEAKDDVDKKQGPALTSQIEKIDSKGGVLIRFSQKMRPIQNLTAIEELLDV